MVVFFFVNFRNNLGVPSHHAVNAQKNVPRRRQKGDHHNNEALSPGTKLLSGGGLSILFIYSFGVLFVVFCLERKPLQIEFFLRMIGRFSRDFRYLSRVLRTRFYFFVSWVL